MKFYRFGGLLVRRRPPVRRGISLEVWNDGQWVPYADVDSVLRQGRPLTEAQAMLLMHEGRVESPGQSSDDDALALRARGKRA